MRNPIRPRAGHEVVEAHPAGAVVDDLLHPPLAQREQLGEHADELLGHVDGDAVDRLVHGAVDLPGQHPRLADGQLEALAPHHLDEHGQLQLAAALRPPTCRGARWAATRMLTLPTSSASRRFLTSRAVSDVPSLPGQRRRVDADRHRQARVVDRDDRQRAGVVGVGERLADRDVGDAGDGDDLARPGLVGRHPVERLGDVQLGDAGPLDRAVGRGTTRPAGPCAACPSGSGTAPGARRTARRRGW